MPENQYGDLDQMRIREGNEACRSLFGDTWGSDKHKALLWLNDKRLTFPCLYALEPQIEAYGISRYLHWRNLAGLSMIRLVRGGARPRGLSLSDRSNAERTALQWIWETGYADDGQNEEYEEILELTASVLINTYRDTSILPLVVDMVFTRNRNGRNIHSLTWALSRSRDPGALRMIAGHICQRDRQDAELACNLLGIGIPEGDEGCRQRRYQSYLQWLDDNDPYLYFTEESMQYASHPVFCRVDQERKYMRKGTPSYDRRPLALGDREQRGQLTAFRSLGDAEKEMLAEHSHSIQDPSAWNTWMRYPVDEQIRIAAREREGSR